MRKPPPPPPLVNNSPCMGAIDAPYVGFFLLMEPFFHEGTFLWLPFLQKVCGRPQSGEVDIYYIQLKSVVL